MGEATGIGLAALTAYVFYRNLKAFLIFLPFGACVPFFYEETVEEKTAGTPFR